MRKMFSRTYEYLCSEEVGIIDLLGIFGSSMLGALVVAFVPMLMCRDAEIQAIVSGVALSLSVVAGVAIALARVIAKACEYHARRPGVAPFNYTASVRQAEREAEAARIRAERAEKAAAVSELNKTEAMFEAVRAHAETDELRTAAKKAVHAAKAETHRAKAETEFAQTQQALAGALAKKAKERAAEQTARADKAEQLVLDLLHELKDEKAAHAATRAAAQATSQGRPDRTSAVTVEFQVVEEATPSVKQADDKTIEFSVVEEDSARPTPAPKPIPRPLPVPPTTTPSPDLPPAAETPGEKEEKIVPSRHDLALLEEAWRAIEEAWHHPRRQAYQSQLAAGEDSREDLQIHLAA